MFAGWLGSQRVGIGKFVLLGNPLARGQAVTTTEDIAEFLGQTSSSGRPTILEQQNQPLADGRQLMLIKYRYGNVSDRNFPSVMLLTFNPKTNELNQEHKFEPSGDQGSWADLDWYGDETVIQLWGENKILLVGNSGIQVADWKTKEILVDKKFSKEIIETESGEEIPEELVLRLPATGYYAAPFVIPLDNNRILISTYSTDTARRVAQGEPVVDVNEIFDLRTNKVTILDKGIGLPYNSRDAKVTKLSNGNYLLVWNSNIYVFNPRSRKIAKTHSADKSGVALSHTSGAEAARGHIVQLDWHRVLINQQNTRQPKVFIHDFIFKTTKEITYNASPVKEGFFAQPPRVGGVARESAPQFAERKSGFAYWLTPVTKTRMLINSAYYQDLPWGFGIYSRNKTEPVYIKDNLPKTPAGTYSGQFPGLGGSEFVYSMPTKNGEALFIGDLWFAYSVPTFNLWDKFVIYWGYLGLAQMGILIVSLLVLAYCHIRYRKTVLPA